MADDLRFDDYCREAKALIETARRQFRSDVDRTLARMRDVASSLEPVIGEVSPLEAFQAWCREMSTLLSKISDSNDGPARPE